MNTYTDSEAEQEELLFQDNFGIIRNIANFQYNGYNTNKLIEILRDYSLPKFAFYLTCSEKERIKRLNGRNKPDDIYEKLLRTDVKTFSELDCLSYEVCKKNFDCELIDNTNMTEEETIEYVLKKVRKL